MEKRVKTKSFISDHLAELVTGVFLLACLVLYILWGFAKEGLNLIGAVASALMLLLLAVSLALSVPKMLRLFKGNPEMILAAMGERSTRRRRIHPVVSVVLLSLLLRLMLFLAAYLISTLAEGYHGTLLSTLKGIWLKADTDASRYFEIAKNLYRDGNGVSPNIALAPLFPMAIRALTMLTGTRLGSSLIISTVCSVLSSAVIYHLALPDLGRRSAKVAVLFTFLMPAAIFYAAPLPEAMLLLMCSSALLAMRRGKFVISGIFISLASLTELSGILLAVPFTAEAAAYLVGIFRDKGAKIFVKKLIVVAVGTLLSAAGFMAYLGLNRYVSGEWFYFIRAAKELKGLEPTVLLNAADSQINGLVSTFGKNNAAFFGLWLPNILHLFGALIVFVAAARTMHSPYSLYFTAYLAVMSSISPLLSVPRYLAGLVVLPLALALLCLSRDDGEGIIRARAKTLVVSAVLIVGQVFYLIMYVLRYDIF
ncbi:MAG: glycosyltransferase family 39 protein [Clostridiales bacterium]|nr:glycosyltransferase family 39 protein [Clostridiales bacterium]